MTRGFVSSWSGLAPPNIMNLVHIMCLGLVGKRHEIVLFPVMNNTSAKMTLLEAANLRAPRGDLESSIISIEPCAHKASSS